jgi:hypothetical protein
MQVLTIYSNFGRSSNTAKKAKTLKNDVLFIHGEQDCLRRIINFLVSTATKTTVDRTRQNTNSFKLSGVVLKI